MSFIPSGEPSNRPSGVMTTQSFSSSAIRVANSFPLITSQSLIVPSPLPLASVLPSGLNSTEVRELECPLRILNSFPVSTSHNFIALLLTRNPLANVLRSGLSATVETGASCLIVFTSCPDDTLHNVTLLSLPQLTVANVLPSGPNLIDAVSLEEDPLRVFSSRPESTSQMVIDVSSIPTLANVFPSGLKATKWKALGRPFIVFNSFPEFASHSFSVLSLLTLASAFPSELNDTNVTESL